MKADLAGFEFVHDEEAAGHLSLRVRSLAVGDGSLAYVAMKESAERAETLKPHFKANIRDAQLVSAKQLLRFLNSAFNQILVRSFIEGLPKQPQEVVTREAGLL